MLDPHVIGYCFRRGRAGDHGAAAHRPRPVASQMDTQTAVAAKKANVTRHLAATIGARKASYYMPKMLIL